MVPRKQDPQTTAFSGQAAFKVKAMEASRLRTTITTPLVSDSLPAAIGKYGLLILSMSTISVQKE